MQKTYLLLRNNNQLGPFTIEELLEQELLPSDLVWIEGKSLAWSYVSELNLLKLARNTGEGVHHSAPGPSHSSVHSAPHGRRKHHRFKKGEIIPPPPPSSPEQKPQVSGPLTPAPMSSAFSQGDVERKAEELRQRALAAERSFHHRRPVPAETEYQPDLIGAIESDIEVVYHKKKRIDIPFPQILVGGMVIAMLVAGWYGKPLFRQKTDTVDATATPLMNTQENAAAATYKPAPVPAAATDTAALADSTLGIPAQPSLAVYTSGGGVAERQATQPEPEVAQLANAAETTEAERPPVVQQKSEPEEKSVAREPEKTTPIVVTAKKEENQADPAAAVTEESKEKKRGFLKGLFKKKKNRDGQSEEEGSDTDSSESQSN